MTHAAIHFIRDGQDNVIGGDGLVGAVPGNHAHHRIGVFLSRIVIGREGNALGANGSDAPGTALTAQVG